MYFTTWHPSLPGCTPGQLGLSFPSRFSSLYTQPLIGLAWRPQGGTDPPPEGAPLHFTYQLKIESLLHGRTARSLRVRLFFNTDLAVLPILDAISHLHKDAQPALKVPRLLVERS
jgi:hypothetical protein